MALNFGVQIMTVRYLSKSDYGALAYALSVVSMSTSAVLFGLDKAIARFVPIYEEREDHSRMVGTVVLALATVLVLGLILVVGVITLDNIVFTRVASDPLSAMLLVTIIALAPIQALESLLQGLFAVFAKPSAIFFRKNLLGPGIKL
ncbi:MAG TPA: oligosaccharide flippase family protein, partial [Aggregatilineales bacterium]|nr:oligosaccharide flippase family protein [Aggregatilineales bacterium]